MKFRFYLYVLLAACVPALLAVTVTGDVAVSAEESIQARLSSAASSLGSKLEADEARRRALLLRLVSLPSVNASLREASADKRSPGPESVAQLRSAVTEFFPRNLPDLFAVGTAQGAQVVVGSGEPRAIALAELPLGAAALEGQSVDAFGRFDGALFHLSAIPVGVGEGVIVVAERIGVTTANRLRDFAKVDHVSFVENESLVTASSLPVESRDMVLPAARAPGNAVESGRLGTGFELLAPLDPYFPILAPAAASRSLGVGLSGEVVLVATLSTKPTLGWLGRLQSLSLLATLALLVLGVVFVSLASAPVKRQARSIEAHLSRLRVEKGIRIGLKGFAGPFRGVATELDKLVEHIELGFTENPKSEAPVDASPRPPKPLDLPLQSAPGLSAFDEPEGTPSAFPFQKLEPATPAGNGVSSPPPTRPPEPVVASRIVEAPVAPSLKPQLPASVPVPAATTASASAAAVVALPAPTQLSQRDAQTGLAIKADPFAAFGPPPEPDADSDRTREAIVPKELLERSRELESELLDPPVDPDEAHFQEVFEKFVASRESLGEGGDGLTYEKFAQRLRKNREQLVERYACRTVRFQVYVKEGKTALKASPVK